MGEDTTRNWVININQRLAKLPDPESESDLWKKRSIYKVPHHLVDLNKKAYHPHVVSFGPYHHGDDHLGPMEDHKPRALLHFLRRSGKPLEEYVDSLRDVMVTTLRECYDPLESRWRDDTEGFLRLMILDGCFMLEILRTDPALNDYADNDPIFSSHLNFCLRSSLMRDMLMIENQLPILLLERLVAVESDGREGKDYVIRLVLKFFDRGINRVQISDMRDCVHVLDVYRMTLLPKKLYDLSNYYWNPQNMPSATKLREAGIHFEKVDNRDIGDISFANGVLKVPVLVVDDSTESLFLNLMAFERLHVNTGNEVSSYISMMDDLIESDKDVALLCSRGIILQLLGSDKEVANLINSVTKEQTINVNCNLAHIHKMMNEYRNKRRNKWRANLIEWRANLIDTYFRNPWSVLALIGALSLFALTTVQTTYTVLQYHQPGN